MPPPEFLRDLSRRLTIQAKLSGVILVLVAAIVIPFSTQASSLRVALTMGGGALGLGLLAAWWIGRSFARRVRALCDQATAVTAGDLSRRPLQDLSSDEIRQTARAFKTMVE